MSASPHLRKKGLPFINSKISSMFIEVTCLYVQPQGYWNKGLIHLRLVVAKRSWLSLLSKWQLFNRHWHVLWAHAYILEVLNKKATTFWSIVRLSVCPQKKKTRHWIIAKCLGPLRENRAQWAFKAASFLHFFKRSHYVIYASYSMTQEDTHSADIQERNTNVSGWPGCYVNLE